MVLGLPVDITSPIRGQASAQMYAQAVQQQVQELKAENFQKLHLLRLPASVMQVLTPEPLRITRNCTTLFAILLGPLQLPCPLRNPSACALSTQKQMYAGRPPAERLLELSSRLLLLQRATKEEEWSTCFVWSHVILATAEL